MVRDSTRAAAWYRIQSALARRAASLAAGAWDRVDPHDIAASWRQAAPAAVTGVALTAFSAGSGAQAYVSGCVSDAGLEPDPEGRLNAAGLVQPEAIGLLLGQVPAVRALTRIQMGVPLADAMNAGRVLAGMIGAQQTADTARDAMTVAMAAEPHVAGWVRHLQAPSCGRCAVLAGRVYEWSAGFARHPACDCVHAPITSDQVDDAQRASSGKPYEYFDSLSEAEQNRRFGAAQATAIRGGESISKVVNTGRSMWRSRYTPSRGPGDLPHSIVEAVMRQTKGDRAAAVAQFKRYKLLDDTGHRRVFATKRSKRFAEANPTEGRTGAEAAANARRHSSAGTGGTGGGKPPGGIMGAGEPGRVLPKLSHHPELPLPADGLPSTSGAATRRPTASDLKAEGVVGVGWEHFTPVERDTARFLADHGVNLVSVRVRGHRLRTPDAVVSGIDATVELKVVEAPTVNAVRGRLKFARRQSGRVVIDGRTAGLGEATALEAVRSELLRRGGDFDEIMIVLADDPAISWP